MFPILLGAVFHSNSFSSGSSSLDDPVMISDSEVNIVKNNEDSDEDEAAEAGKVEKEETTAVVVTKARRTPRIWSLISSLLLGDALHNFCDGLFIGTGFLLCGRTVAYGMVASTIYHEIAQEISDYNLLVYYCNFSPALALLLNFLSGISVLLGALLVLFMEFSNETIGIMLSISSGVFIFIGACECIPRVQESQKSVSDIGIILLSFVLGAIPIGLVLLNHGHCE